ncbi:hypothetical protein [Streptomyces sp. URMC 129]|uniref:hypothetical protein n=1 Tax=Streptomyces sp. URMC 129 TaxID=3423407 RepID=UPI003F19D811
MAALNLIKMPVDGGVSLDAGAVAASGGGDTAPTGAGCFLYVKNGSGASITATLATPGEVDGLAVADAVLTVPAGAAGAIPLAAVFAGANSRASITYSAVTTVTVAAYQVGS